MMWLVSVYVLKSGLFVGCFVGSNDSRQLPSGVHWLLVEDRSLAGLDDVSHTPRSCFPWQVFLDIDHLHICNLSCSNSNQGQS